MKFKKISWQKIKKSLKETFEEDKAIVHELHKNAKRAIEDLESGKVFHDDEAAENLKNAVTDLAKIAGMAGIFALPGGAAGLVALRTLLKSKEAEKLGIKNLLTLTDIHIEKLHKDDQPAAN